MKNACIKLILPALALSVFLSAGGGAIAAGTGLDPLISLSYMQNIVKTELSEAANDKAADVIKPGSREDMIRAFGINAIESLSLEDFAESVSDELLTVVELPSEIPGVNNQREVSLSSEWVVNAAPGSTIFIKDGSIDAILGENAGIIDILECAEVNTNKTLVKGNYIVVSEKGNVVFSPKGNATLLVTGVATYTKPLTGSVSIDGNAIFGNMLAANLSGLTNSYAKYRYEWTRDGTPVGTENVYSITAEDVGKELTLTVSGEGVFTGSLSATVTPVKAAQTKPADPELLSKTFNSVTLAAVSGCEYRCGNGAWQTSPVFSGLNGDTQYDFYMRKAESSTHFASPQSSGLTVKTYPASITSSKYSLNLSSGLISKINTRVTVTEFLSNVSYPEFVSIYKGDSRVTGSAYIGSGMTVKLIVDATTLQTLTIAVTGDINGDGKITLTDFVNLKAHLLNKSVLAGGTLKAADVNGDGRVTLTDFVKLKAHLLGKETIAGLGY